MAESLLVRAQAAGGSSGAQLVIGQAFSKDSANRDNPCTVNGSSMLMAAVRIYNGNYVGRTQPYPEWFIVVIGDDNIPLNVTLTYNNTPSTEAIGYATMTTTQLVITGDRWGQTYFGVSGRIFCTA